MRRSVRCAQKGDPSTSLRMTERNGVRVMLPELNRIRKTSNYISVFKGLNRTDNTGFSRISNNNSSMSAEFADMSNLCVDDFPRLLTRKERSFREGLTVKSNLIAADRKLIFITEESEESGGTVTVTGKLRVGDEEYTITTGYDSSAEHRITQYGNNVIIQPENVYFNLSSHEFENIEFSLTSEAEDLSTTELNVAKFNTGSYVRRVLHFRDFSIEKVELDENGKPRKVNYIYEKASGLEDPFKQGNPSDTDTSDATYVDKWQEDYFAHWNTIKIGETVEAQGESPSGVYRCIDIKAGKTFIIDGQTLNTKANLRTFVKIESPYVMISRTPATVTDPPADLFAGLKKGDWVKISEMTDSVKKPLIIDDTQGSEKYWADVDGVMSGNINYPAGFWGNYLEVLNGNTFKVYYADENCIVIKANIDKSVPYNGNMIIERVMPDIDSGKMLEVGNRLWACSSQNNEIYSSKQGDIKNWQAYGDGIATDSYAATVGCEGDFTGIARQNDSVIFFKENWILKLYGTKPSNYAIASYNVPGVERGSEKSIVWINGVLYYLSHLGVCQYSPGGQPVVISQKAFGYEKYKNAVAGRHRDKYYISAQNKSGSYELFVFDTATGLWHKEDNTQMVDTVTYNNVLYYTDSEGKLVCADKDNNLLGDQATVEGGFEWSFETGNLYESDFGKKYISRIQLGIKSDTDMQAKVWAQYENGGAWVLLRELHYLRRRHSLIPVQLRRADYLKLRVKGAGMCQISGIQIEYSGGSAR